MEFEWHATVVASSRSVLFCEHGSTLCGEGEPVKMPCEFSQSAHSQKQASAASSKRGSAIQKHW